VHHPVLTLSNAALDGLRAAPAEVLLAEQRRSGTGGAGDALSHAGCGGKHLVGDIPAPRGRFIPRHWPTLEDWAAGEAADLQCKVRFQLRTGDAGNHRPM
jgi:hypothetical protein